MLDCTSFSAFKNLSIFLNLSINSLFSSEALSHISVLLCLFLHLTKKWKGNRGENIESTVSE